MSCNLRGPIKREDLFICETKNDSRRLSLIFGNEDCEPLNNFIRPYSPRENTNSNHGRTHDKKALESAVRHTVSKNRFLSSCSIDEKKDKQNDRMNQQDHCNHENVAYESDSSNDISDGKYSEENSISQLNVCEAEAANSSPATQKSESMAKDMFPLPSDCLIRLLCFLTFDEIMKTQILCKYFRTTVRSVFGTFGSCKTLVINGKWSKLPPQEREFYMRQMSELRYLTVCAEAFMNNGMTIHEVSSLVAQNVRTLRSLQLFSPENPMKDSTLKHEPFEFVPLQFPRLTKLSMAGCQVLEWLHILGNCDFLSVERFEVSYYPLPHDHWSWTVAHDFTKQGIQGLHKILDTMSSLERLTVGFDLWFESSALVAPPAAFTSRREPPVLLFNFDENENGEILDLLNQPDGQILPSVNSDEETINLPPVGGYGQLQSYRGRLSEEDYSDIFSIALVRGGGTGSLKRVVMKYRMNETKVSDSEQLNPVVDFFEAAGSFIARYINDVITKITGTNE